MWMPVIVILWQLGPAQVWLTFPQPTFPFVSMEMCEQFTMSVRENIILNPTYRDGWSACVEVPKGSQKISEEKNNSDKIPL